MIGPWPSPMNPDDKSQQKSVKSNNKVFSFGSAIQILIAYCNKKCNEIL